MKKKNVVALGLVVIVFMLAGLAAGLADGADRKAVVHPTAEIYEVSTTNPAERLERVNAFRAAALEAGVEVKAADAVAINERTALLTEKQNIHLLEERYTAEKQAIIDHFFQSGGSPTMNVASGGLEADMFEPDNSHNQGEKLIDGFVSKKHTIYPAGDIDFFWFEGNAGDVVEIMVNTPNPYWGTKEDPYQLLPVSETDLDPYMVLYLPDRSVFVADDDLGPGWDSYINVQLPETGVYYISVEASPMWAQPTVGGYEIGLRFVKPDPFEPDNDPMSAHELVSGDVRTGHTIYPMGDVDFFTFEITQPGTALRGIVVSTPGAANVRITEFFHVPDLDPAVDIFDENMNLLYTMDDTNNPWNPELGIYDVEVLFSFPDPGVYYFLVRASDKVSPVIDDVQTRVGSYKLEFNLVLPDPFEPDNIPPLANLIAYGDVRTGHTITSILDGDMFKFEGSKGDFVSIIVDGDNKCGDLDPGVALFGTKGNPGNGTWNPDGVDFGLDWLHSSMDDGIGLGAHILWGPLPYNGWYIIEVGADPLSYYNWWERSGSYTLKLRKMGENATFPRNRNKAIPITIGDEVSGFIPRAGVVWPDDEDVTTLPNWFSFEGSEGQTIAATVRTPFQYRSGCGTLMSDWMDDLNPMLTLFQADPNTKLAVNKNIDPMNEWDDARVVFTLPADGKYYLKVEAEIVQEGPLFEFFGDADSFGEFTLDIVSIPRVVDFDSDRNVGHAPLFVNFFDHCIVEDDPWATEFVWDASHNMGFMMHGKTPYYCYWMPQNIGYHDVLKTGSNAAGSASELKERFIQVYEPNGYAPMVVVEGQGDFPKEPWEAAVDADIYCWNGVATVRVVDDVNPWAVFKFADDKTKIVNKVRFRTEAGLNLTNRWARKVQVLANDGVAADFQEVMVAMLSGPEWQEFVIEPAITAKTLKLVVLDEEELAAAYTGMPQFGSWRQISEFEAYEDIVIPCMDKSLLTATSPHLADGMDASKIQVKLVDKMGNPITVYDEKDVKFYLAECKDGDFGPVDLSEAADGIYKTTLVSKQPGDFQVLAVAHGAVVVNDKPGDHYKPTIVSFFGYSGQKGNLVFVEGSESHAKEPWENAVNGKRVGWSNTATVKGDPCYAIFKFDNEMTMPINKIGFATDNGFDDDKVEFRQVKDFVVHVSHDMVNWTKAVEVKNARSEYYRYGFPTVLGKYVKLEILKPESGWRQLVAFEAIFDSKDGFNVEDADVAAIPKEFAVYSNYPNPFNPTTTISYQLPEQMHVNISVYNVIGQRVAMLVDEQVNAGYHNVIWNAENQPSGVYMYRIEAGPHTQTNTMVLLK